MKFNQKQQLIIDETDDDLYWSIINEEITEEGASLIMKDMYGIDLNEYVEDIK